MKMQSVLMRAATACLALAAGGLRADVRLPAVFGHHMVLQRGCDVPVWGWADPGEEIRVSVHTSEAAATADEDGRWRVVLAPVDAEGPHEMTVAGTNEIVLSDVLVGEVWLCSGQSNMEWGIKAVEDAEAEAAAADHPRIRLFHVPHTTSGYPEDDVAARWKPCAPETIVEGGWLGFSAVAYYFGRAVQKELGVPVGLIDSSWGGTRIEPWMPRIGFESAPSLGEALDQIRAAEPAYHMAMATAANDVEDYIPSLRQALSEGRRLPGPPEWPKHGLDQVTGPTGIYNGMIHPLAPFAIRGAIWYQGESNRGDGMLYAEKMKALIGGWRTVWAQGDFPFYFVQLAPFRHGDGKPWLLPEIWEAQTASLAIPNTGMVVTTDVGNIDDIHPRNKKNVGERLALLALAETYDRRDRVHSGPLYESHSVENGTVRVWFAHAESGLASRDGGALTWFQVAGEDRVFHDAAARIDGRTVVAGSGSVPHPVAVRFGWHQEAQPNLVNREGLPASPFRTDDWEREEAPADPAM